MIMEEYMKRFILGLGGALAATSGVQAEQMPIDPQISDLANALQGQYVVRDAQLPTQELMTFEQLRRTGKAYLYLTKTLNEGGDVDQAATNVLNTLKGSKRIQSDYDELELVKERIIFNAESYVNVFPGLADPKLEQDFGWHSGSTAMTCFHEPTTGGGGR